MSNRVPLRNLLVMEQDGALWLARAWLGTRQTVSDADNGRITATVNMPSRNAPDTVLLRLRHPKAADQGRHGQRQAVDGVQ